MSIVYKGLGNFALIRGEILCYSYTIYVAFSLWFVTLKPS